MNEFMVNNLQSTVLVLNDQFQRCGIVVFAYINGEELREGAEYIKLN